MVPPAVDHDDPDSSHIEARLHSMLNQSQAVRAGRVRFRYHVVIVRSDLNSPRCTAGLGPALFITTSDVGAHGYLKWLSNGDGIGDLNHDGRVVVCLACQVAASALRQAR